MSNAVPLAGAAKRANSLHLKFARDWDHCLAKNFDQYASESLEIFVKHIYNSLQSHDGNYTAAYHRLTNAMIDYDWLNHYAHFDGVVRALQGLSRRRSFLEPLSDCVPSLERHQESLENIFHEFYPKLVQASRQWRDEIPSIH